MSEETAEQRIAQVKEQAKAVEWRRDAAQISAILSDGVDAAKNPVHWALEEVSSQVGEWLAKKVHAAEAVEAVFDFVGLDRIGLAEGETPHPATVDLQVAHSHAVWGFLGAIAVGVGVGLVIALSGGTAAVVIIGAAAAGGFATEALVSAASNFGQHVGPIVTGSPNVFIRGKRAARMTDVAACEDHPEPRSPIVEGSQTIQINGLPLARVGHQLLCGAVIDEGVRTVIVDRTTQR